MPKPLKKKRQKPTRRPTDPNLWARQLVDESTAEPTIPPAALSAYMSALGRKGGKVSGAKRMEMPVEQRKAIALLAARARWKKKRPKG